MAVLIPRLAVGSQILLRPPYVLAGDLSETELEELYRNIVQPTARALSVSYFDRQPDSPILLLVFSNEKTYRWHAERFDQRPNTDYYGYYVESECRIMLDISTGTGTVAHELTHALAHFDFAQMPEWFDEGLASVHEQSEFSEDGLRLIGLSNWRINPLRQALENHRLQPLVALISRQSVREHHQSIDYAQSRYFCLYLQHRRLLEAFLSKIPRECGHRPSGHGDVAAPFQCRVTG